MFSVHAQGTRKLPRTYYVDQTAGNNSNSGLKQDAAFKTISKINGLTFLPNDRVLFKRGETWRERLTVPSSGASGRKITFGAYGAGAKPIINGSNIYTGFVQRITYTGFTAEGETVVLDKASSASQSQTLNNNNRIWVGQGSWTSDGNYTIDAMEIDVHSVVGTGPGALVAEIYTMSGTSLDTRVGNTSAELTPTGAQLLKFTGLNASISNGTVYSLVVRRADSSYSADNWCWIHCDNSNSWDGAWQTWNSSKTSTVITSSYELGVKLYQGGVSPYYTSYTEAPTTVYFDDAALSENTTSKASLATGQWWKDTANSRIYLYDNPAGHTVKGNDHWNTAYITTPNQIFSDGTLLTKNTTSKASLATGQWFDGTGKIYLYDDPTSKTIEGGYNSTCVWLAAKSYITVQDLHIKNANNHGLWVDTSAYANRFDSVTIKRCTVENAFNMGILAGGAYATTDHGIATGLSILNNTFTNNGIAGSLAGNTSFAVDITGNSPTDYIEDVLVQGNTVTGGYGGMKGDWFSNDIIFENNYINCSNTAFAIDGGQNITFRYNIIDGSNNLEGWVFSVFRWEGSPGPPYGFAISDVHVYNNTSYLYKNCVQLTNAQTDTIVRNNIFHSNIASNSLISIGTGTQTGRIITNNIYYTGANATKFTISGIGTYTFSEWQTEGYDANSINADPLCVSSSDFHLQAGSPAINAGVNVGLTTDYEGKAVGDPPEIGAYEYP